MNTALNYQPEVLVDTADLSREDWLDYRRLGIGGSDAAAIMGLSPFSTIRDLYFDKIGVTPVIEEEEENWVAKEVGHRLEDLVAMIFAKKTGLEVFPVRKMFRHPLYPFMLADVDYFIRFPDGSIGILECKTCNYNAKDKWADDGIPENYVLQVRHLYGKLDASGETFADEGKTTLVMMPALGVPSPHIYFKPLAQSLDESFNIVIVEPFGYGLSDVAATDRTVDNINSELNAALDTMGIKQCVLLVHSISGVYGLNFVQNYPEKVKGFIAVDNTVYDEELAEAMEMEKKYMLQGIDEFQKIKNSFSSLEEFQMALKTDPDKYGAALPQVSGYTYTESDREEYIQAYSLSSNDTIRNEVNGMDQSLLSIKNKKFPSALPVLTMISSENVQNVPAWETAHRNQLDLESGNHQLYIVNGGHYIWYTNLTQVVQLIDEWRIENHF